MNAGSKIVQDHSRLRPAIERELREIFHTRTSAAAAYGGQFVRLWTLAGESVLGGKLVRPFLMLETFDALTEHVPQSDHSYVSGASAEPIDGEPCSREIVIQIASAIELLHYSFLLHDDVIDGDLTRRGRPNLVGALLAENGSVADHTSDNDPQKAVRDVAGLHWARTGGILMGDLLLSSTHQTFARAQVGPATRVRLLDLLEHTITESVAGEQVDVGLGDGIIVPDLGTILAMCANKTATYTFELPLRAAAILAGANPRLENALVTAGRHLGLAFQLQDDLLSVFGDPSLHGKDAFSDLREGKQTALIAYARMTSAWPSMEPLFGQSELSNTDCARLRTLLTGCGAERFVQGLVDEQLRAFYELLASPVAEIPSRARRVLLELAGQLEGRNA
jgi:geranylgeranyl diphosphate synthase type II